LFAEGLVWRTFGMAELGIGWKLLVLVFVGQLLLHTASSIIHKTFNGVDISKHLDG
jgi:hypothetical protein